jgi:ABC-type multidrug transport system fused ATPase/permease subunit
MPEMIYYLGLFNENNKFMNELRDIKFIDRPKITIDKGDIIINDVTFSYDDKIIFENLNLRIKSNSRVAFVGSSGSGKSTLIKLIIGFYKPKSGKIQIDDKNIHDFDMDSYRSQISYIHQNTILFNRSVYENIIYGKDIERDKVNDLIRELKIDKIFKKLKDGIETKVGVNGSNLSGGQRQCIHLLRALLIDNKIIIMDEPTSAIDYEHKKTIMEIIEKISKDKTLILITHDPSNLDFMDNVYKIEDGKII